MWLNMNVRVRQTEPESSYRNAHQKVLARDHAGALR
jgi:hypothetical protein